MVLTVFMGWGGDIQDDLSWVNSRVLLHTEESPYETSCINTLETWLSYFKTNLQPSLDLTMFNFFGFDTKCMTYRFFSFFLTRVPEPSDPDRHHVNVILCVVA